MTAVLTFLDFFPIMSQRDAVVTAARIAQHADAGNVGLFESIIPNITNLVDPGTDKVLLENACLCFHSLAEALEPSTRALGLLASHGFVQRALTVLTADPQPLSPTHFTLVLTTLAILARACPAVGADLLKSRAYLVLNRLLRGGTAAVAAATGDTGIIVVDDEVPTEAAAQSADADEDDKKKKEENAEDAGAAASARAPSPNQMAALPGTSGASFALSSQQLTDLVHIYANMLPPTPAGASAFAAHMAEEYGPQPTVKWEWTESGQRWSLYPKSLCQQLEAAHASGRATLTMLVDGRQCLVNLADMQMVELETRRRRRLRRGKPSRAPSSTTSPAADVGSAGGAADARAQLLAGEEGEQLLADLLQHSLGLLFDIYLSSAYLPLRHACLEMLLRELMPAPTAMLAKLLTDVSISSYLAEMLSSGNDHLLALGALTTMEVLLDKLPEIFAPLLRRKGAAHATVALSRQLAVAGDQGAAAAASDASTANSSSSAATAAAATAATTASSSGAASNNSSSGNLRHRLRHSSHRSGNSDGDGHGARSSRRPSEREDQATRLEKRQRKIQASVVSLAQQLTRRFFQDVADGRWDHESFAQLR